MLYVERPVFLDDVRRPALDCTEPMPGIHRIVPRLPVMYATIEHAAQMMVRTLLLEWIDANAECRARFESPINGTGLRHRRRSCWTPSMHGPSCMIA